MDEAKEDGVNRTWQAVRRAAAHPVVRGLAVVLLHAAAARLEQGPRGTAGPGPGGPAPGPLPKPVARPCPPG